MIVISIDLIYLSYISNIKPNQLTLKIIRMNEKLEVVIMDLYNPPTISLCGENLRLYNRLDMMEKGIKYYENSKGVYNYVDYYQYNYKSEIIDYFKSFYVNSMSFLGNLFN